MGARPRPQLRPTLSLAPPLPRPCPSLAPPRPQPGPAPPLRAALILVSLTSVLSFPFTSLLLYWTMASVSLFSFSGRWWFRSWFPVASDWARVPLLARSACVLVAPAPALPAPRPCSAAPAEVGSEGEVVPCPAPPGHGRDSVCTPSVRG